MKWHEMSSKCKSSNKTNTQFSKPMTPKRRDNKWKEIHDHIEFQELSKIRT